MGLSKKALGPQEILPFADKQNSPPGAKPVTRFVSQLQKEDFWIYGRNIDQNIDRYNDPKYEALFRLKDISNLGFLGWPRINFTRLSSYIEWRFGRKTARKKNFNHT